MEAKEKSWEEFAVSRSANETSYMRGIADYKASLREAIEANIKVLQSNVDNSITPYIKIAWSAHLDENKKFLTLIDTVNPKN